MNLLTASQPTGCAFLPQWTKGHTGDSPLIVLIFSQGTGIKVYQFVSAWRGVMQQQAGR